jgi:hypothetical protein
LACAVFVADNQPLPKCLGINAGALHHPHQLKKMALEGLVLPVEI